MWLSVNENSWESRNNSCRREKNSPLLKSVDSAGYVTLNIHHDLHVKARVVTFGHHPKRRSEQAEQKLRLGKREKRIEKRNSQRRSLQFVFSIRSRQSLLEFFGKRARQAWLISFLPVPIDAVAIVPFYRNRRDLYRSNFGKKGNRIDRWLVCAASLANQFNIFFLPLLPAQAFKVPTRIKSEKMDFYYTPGRFQVIGMRLTRSKKMIPFKGSAPCRAVQMAAEAVGAKLNLKVTNLMAGEHLKPEYLAVSSHAVECKFRTHVAFVIEA